MTPDDYAGVRDAAGSGRLIAFEDLEPSPREPADTRHQELDMILDGEWSLGAERTTMRPPIAWKHDNRTFEFHLHAWDPVALLLAGYDAWGDDRYFDAALTIADDWLVSWQDQLLADSREPALNEAEHHAESMAWYDMGTGQRAYRLAYVADVLARRGREELEVFSRAFEALRFHVQLLSRDSFFVGHTNHGLFQALGLMAAARRFRFLPEFEEAYQLGSQRLDIMLERSFFASGVHREHSPGYHLWILNSLFGAREAGLVTDAARHRLALAEEALAWMIGPRGTLATIGDTDYDELSLRPEQLHAYTDEHVRHLMSGGEVGSPPADGLMAYRDAGYAFIRDSERGSYLAHAAAFHSRTHKHADHFTFVWWEAEEEVLVDPGRFGYLEKTVPGSDEHTQGFWYADPRRIYVEKTRAHNCVEIDGCDYPRRGVKPFGSALIQADKQRDLYVTGAEARHFRQVRHRRNLILRPGHFLLVLDWLFDRTGEAHQFKQWFQIAPQWQRNGVDTRSVAFRSSSNAHLWVCNLLAPTTPAVVRGQPEPRMSGWRSDKAESLVPATSLHTAADGETARFATLFLLGSGEPSDRTRTNTTLRQGRFSWWEGDREREVLTTWGDDRMHATFR